MRMWMIPPENLCNRHLVGEHGELHKHRHVFVKRQSISGRISPVVQIEPVSMKTRHNDLALEMLYRGMNHNSPYEMPDISYLPADQRYAKVNLGQSYLDLGGRCEKCRALMCGEAETNKQEVFALIRGEKP